MSNRDLALRFYELVNAGDVDAAMELATDDFVDHEEFPGLPSGKEGVRQFFTMMRSAFPDFHMQAHEIVAEGDLVSVRMSMTGTHEGEFMGIPASGRRIDVPGFDLVRVRDGKAVEHWGVTDNLAMMQQLGAIPAEAPTG